MRASTSAATLLATLLLATTASLVLAKEQYNDVTMLCLVNKERKANGLKPLGLDPKLTAAAYKHSKDQAKMRKMSHTGSDGSDASERADSAGFKWKSIAENVAYGYDSMKEVMKTWMNSSGHRRNILGSSYTMFGSGVAYNGNTPYFTQEFGSDGKPARNIPKCDGSDTTPNYDGGAAGDMNDEEDTYSGGQDDAGNNQDSYGGEQDSGSKGGRRGGRKSGSEDQSYDDEESSGGRRGGRQSGGEDQSYGDKESSSGRRSGRRGGRRRGRRGGRRSGRQSGGEDQSYDDEESSGGRRGGRQSGSEDQTYGDEKPSGGRGGDSGSKPSRYDAYGGSN